MNKKLNCIEPDTSNRREKHSTIDRPSYRQRKGFLAAFGGALLICCAVSIAGTASAKTITVENYPKHRNAFMNFHVSWLDGVFNGLKGANAELKRTHKVLLFCPPANFSMTELQVNAFFDRFVTSHKHEIAPSDAIGALLLKALEEAYPCA